MAHQAKKDPSVDGSALRFPWQLASLVTVGVGLLITMAEVSRMSGSILSATGQVWEFADLMGLGAWSARAGWQASYDGTLWSSLLVIYLLLDVAFIILYAFTFNTVVKSAFDGRRYVWSRALLILLVLVDVIEDVLAFIARGGSNSPGFAGVLAILSMVKCGLGVLAVLVGGYAVLTGGRRSFRQARRLVGKVAKQHRLSWIPLGIIAVVSLTPGAEILDQVPDVQRRWSEGWGTLLGEGLPALIALLIFGATLLLVGRARAHQAARPETAAEVDQKEAKLWLWWIPPAAVTALAIALAVASADVHGWRVVAVWVVPALVVASSAYLRQKAPIPMTPIQAWTPNQITLLVWVGDSLALGAIVIGLLGVVRSLTAVVVLGILDPVSFSGPAVAILLLDWIAVIAIWPLTCRMVRPLAHRERGLIGWLTPKPGTSNPKMLQTFPGWYLAGATVLFLVLGVLPDAMARLGVVVVFTLSLLSISSLIAGAGLVLQNRKPPEVFLRLGFGSTPILLLALIGILFAGQINALTPIHAVRSTPQTKPEQPVDTRADIGTIVDPWAKARIAAGCTNGTALPMVLVASQGGGIRAAYWTVESLRPLAGEQCAQTATLFSSGVSGGAVGLAVSRFNTDPHAVVSMMSDSRGLGLALAGLLVRDFAYAATGVPLPALSHGTGITWLDRAALMEDAWNTSGPSTTGWRDRPFTPVSSSDEAPQPAVQPVTGSVILNSMSVGNACRIWVSELKLRPTDDNITTANDGKIDCDQAGASGLRSIDLISAYGSVDAGTSDATEHDGCLYGLRSSTAAMLAARFPYVTPSGRIGACQRSKGTAPEDQLVDGGYLENSGLGTVNDLSDVWLPQVRDWNAAEAVKKADQHFIVPLIVYLDNDSGFDRNPPKRDLTNEALLPPLARLHANSDATSDEANRQRALDLTQPQSVCPADSPACSAAVSTVPKRVFVVYPASTPQITPPLGWVLSEASRTAMTNAVTAQQGSRCADQSTAGKSIRTAVCDRGFGTLGDLLAAIRTPET